MTADGEETGSGERDDSDSGDPEQEPVPLDGDELAGIVELFGALDRSELTRAASELLYRRGRSPEELPIDRGIEAGLESYALVVAPGASDPVPDGEPIVAGPTAFPTIPDRAEDLPHILDVEHRSIDRNAVGDAVAERYRDAVDAALGSGDDERIERLLDLGYEIESWAPVDLTDERDRLAAASE